VKDVELRTDPVAFRHARATLERVFPELPVRLGVLADDDGGPLRRERETVVISSAEWHAPAFDLRAFDEQLVAARFETGRIALRIADDDDRRDLARTAIQIVTRGQRFLYRRNRHTTNPLFDDILALHFSLHDVTKPLVVADYAHALDSWQWLLRLEPEASLATQTATLFHDVERLASESERRIEQNARDYLAFKRAHARAGALMARDALERVNAPAEVIDRVAELIATHEDDDADPEKRLVNEADALSFFSLNACGFYDYYGVAHTEKKVGYTLRRLSPHGRRQLRNIRLRPVIAEMVQRRMIAELAAGPTAEAR
jgi:hypothetical protein